MTDETHNQIAENISSEEAERQQAADNDTSDSEERVHTPLDDQQLQRILEGALLAAGHPLTVEKLLQLFEEEAAPEKAQLLGALQAVQASCEGRGFELKEVASGWRFQVRAETAPWVNRLWDEKPQKYSRALLETLSLIAYRQPITRGDIEEIRGVAVSSHIIKTLSERDWVKVVGHRDVPGRPSLYATTRQFLDYFNLKSLEDLPTLGEIKDLDQLNSELAFDDQKPAEGGTQSVEATVADETNGEQVSSVETLTADEEASVVPEIIEDGVQGENVKEESVETADDGATTESENHVG